MRTDPGGSAVWASRCFAAILVIALPVLVFGLGDHRWFHGDDWSFVFGRDAKSFNDYFRPNNAHWSTVPVVAFKVLYELFGLHSYRPYQVVVVTLHLTAATLVRALMRRAGVNPWIATAAATALVFFGAGYANIVWAFQIGFCGALAFGLAHLLLSDHDGPIDRRDWFGVVFGLLAIMSAGVGVITVLTVGLAALLRRGWRVAAFHTAPLAVIYVVWMAIVHPDNSSGDGMPTPGTVADWVSTSETGTFLGLGGWTLVAWVLALVTVGGMVIAWVRSDGRYRPTVPTAMALGGVAFIVTASLGRWPLGLDAARGSRFLHIIAAFTLPAIALGATAVADRLGRPGVPVMVALLVVGIGPGLDDFSAFPFHSQYFAEQQRILTNVTRLPESRLVPADVRPTPDPFRARFVEVGNFRRAVREGKFEESDEPMTAKLRGEMLVRLGVSADPDSLPVPGDRPCPTFTEPVDLAPTKGDRLRITSRVRITTLRQGDPTSVGVLFRPEAGTVLTIELDDLRLRVSSASREGFELCRDQ